MNTRMLGVIAALGLAIALWFLLWPDVATVAPKVVAEVAPMRAESPVVVREPGGLESDPPAQEPLATARVEPAPLPGETPATPMAQLMGERQNIIRRAGAGNDEFPTDVAAGEQEFAAEPVDASWAAGAEADLLAKFAQMPGLALVDLRVECRSTMCRLQMTQPRRVPAQDGDPRSFNILRDSIGLEPRWVTAAVSSRGGPMTSVAYYWREGFAPKRAQAQPREAN